MAWLDENNKFISQTNLGWTFSFEANGRRPMIANRIFATKAGAEAYIADTTANASAIPGLILRVIEDTAANNGAYLVEEDLEAVSGLKLTRIVTGTLDISGEMIDVIRYEGDATHEAGLYNKADGSGDPWVPSENAQPIKDELVTDEGKYLCLVLNETDKVYIKSTDLIDLTDYYTKEQVDAEIEDVNNKIIDLSTAIYDYVDESIEDVSDDIKNINSSIGRIDTSVLDLFSIVTEFVNTVSDHIEYIDSSIENINNNLEAINGELDTLSNDIDEIDNHLDNIDSSIEDLKNVDSSLEDAINDVSLRLAEIEGGTVDSISTDGNYIHVDTSKGDVTFTADVVDSSDQSSFPSSGLVTDGYVEERLDVFNWVEVENE